MKQMNRDDPKNAPRYTGRAGRSAVSAGLLLVWLTGCQAILGVDTGDSPDDPEQVPPIDEYLFDVEEFETNESLDGTHTWTVESQESGFTGAGYVRALPVDMSHLCDDNDTGPGPCGALLAHLFTTVGGGNYLFSIRAWSDGADSNSVWWAVDDMEPTSMIIDTRMEWHWNEGASVGPIFLAEGEHTVTIWMRENGVSLDQVRLELFAP